MSLKAADLDESQNRALLDHLRTQIGDDAFEHLRRSMDEDVICDAKYDEVVGAGVLPRGEITAHGFEPLLQARDVHAKMPRAAGELVERFLVFAMQAAQASHLGIDARLFDGDGIAGSNAFTSAYVSAAPSTSSMRRRSDSPA